MARTVEPLQRALCPQDTTGLVPLFQTLHDIVLFPTFSTWTHHMSAFKPWPCNVPLQFEEKNTPAEIQFAKTLICPKNTGPAANAKR